LLVAHGISRLLVGSTFDGGEKLGKFVAGSQDNILEILLNSSGKPDVALPNRCGNKVAAQQKILDQMRGKH
jgi:hypothetical protein